jgi:hypothetical protein
MTEDEQHERRRRNPDTARARRVAQQQQWEHHRPAQTTGSDSHITDAFAAALGAVVEAGTRLPDCDRAARLHAGLKRISETDNRAQARQAVGALLQTSEEAIAEDPWMRFHLAVLRLVDTIEAL